MRIGIVVACLVAVTGVGAVARADDIAAYDAEGDAELSGADPRVAALDEAFGRAVTMALGDLVAAEARAAHKADVDREIVGHARLWVASYKVTRDTTNDDRRQLTVNVRVDREKMRARLVELNVPTMSVSEASRGRSVTVLLRIADAKGARASYGQTAEKDLPGLGALSSALRGGGLSVSRAPASGPAARAAGDLPLEDDEAEALAGDAKAELAAIAGVTVGIAVPARGVAVDAVLVSAHIRMIERRGHKVIGEGRATVAARGTDDAVVAHAVEHALIAAVSDVLPPAKQALSQAQGFTGNDAPISEAGVVLVRLGPSTPWGMVVAEQKYLAGARGVQRAVLRRLSPGGWVIGVTTTESIERIANIVRKPPATDTAVKITVKGDVIDVAMSGAP